MSAAKAALSSNSSLRISASICWMVHFLVWSDTGIVERVVVAWALPPFVSELLLLLLLS